MDGFQAELLRRLPLAQAVLRGFGYTLAPATLDTLFAEHRGRCYEDVFRFPHLVALILDALSMHQGSGHRAFVAAGACGALRVAEQNAYGKLARIPAELSMALVRASSLRLRDLLSDATTMSLPPSLAGLRLIAYDGQKLKNAAKRRKALRGRPGKPRLFTSFMICVHPRPVRRRRKRVKTRTTHGTGAASHGGGPRTCRPARQVVV